MDALVAPPIRNAAWWLLVGGSLATVGAFWPPYRQWIAPLEEGMRVIAAHPIGWKLIHLWFVAGTWIVVVGLGVLALAMRGREGASAALVAAVMFALASACWSLVIACRLCVTVQAANHLVTTGSLPEGYAVWRTWTGRLFAGFSLLAYGSIATTGWAMLRSGLVSRGLGWLLVVWGVTLGFVIGRNVPLVAYIPAIILGSVLLRA